MDAYILFFLSTLVVCMLAAWEWGRLANLVSRSQRVLLATTCGCLLELMFFSVPTYSCAIHYSLMRWFLWLSLGWWSAALLLLSFYPQSAAAWRHSCVLRLLFGLLTIVSFFWGMLVLRLYGYEENHFTGAWWLLYVMLLVWGMDSSAYMLGKLFGNHKLAPKVSPGKTWEGLFGGLITSAVIGWLFARYVPLNIAPETLLIYSVLTLLAAVLGDLVESMLKREAGIKDSGCLIPGHGGILDRIDSLTAAVPLFACMMLC